MITIDDFNRLVAQLKSKIFLLVGRGILKAVNNAQQTQKIQLTGLAGETRTDMERPQPYGMESFPYTGAEVVFLSINGNRNQGLAALIYDRRYRLKDLALGEVALYTKGDTDADDNIGRHRIHMKPVSAETDIIATFLNITAENNAQDDGWIKAVTKLFELTVRSGFSITGDPIITGDVEVTGILDVTGNIDSGADITAGGNVADSIGSMADIRLAYNAHIHPHGLGPGNTGPPVPLM